MTRVKNKGPMPRETERGRGAEPWRQRCGVLLSLELRARACVCVCVWSGMMVSFGCWAIVVVVERGQRAKVNDFE